MSILKIGPFEAVKEKYRKGCTVKELHDKGLIQKGQLFYKAYKGKILKNSPFAKTLRYRKRVEYDLYKFIGIDQDGRYDFDLIARFSENRIFKQTGLLSSGAQCEFDL